jgi:hypothetical protein
MVIQHLGKKSIQTHRDKSDVLRHIIKNVSKSFETSPIYLVWDVLVVVGNIFFSSSRFLREKCEREKMEESDGVSSTQTATGSDTAEGTELSPVSVLINSSELRAAGFKVKEVLLQHLRQLLAYTRGAGLRSLEGMGPKRFVLSVDDDTEFRSRCE